MTSVYPGFLRVFYAQSRSRLYFQIEQDYEGYSLWTINVLSELQLTWEKKHLTLFDRNIFELSLVDNLEQHVSLYLIEPFLASVSHISLNIQGTPRLGLCDNRSACWGRRAP